MNKWISVKDRLPEDKQDCIICIKSMHDPEMSVEFGMFSKDGGRNVWTHGWDEDTTVWDDADSEEGITHWMPLPEPPEDT